MFLTVEHLLGWGLLGDYIPKLLLIFGSPHWMPKSIRLPKSYHFYYENDAKQALAEKEEKEEG